LRVAQDGVGRDPLALVDARRIAHHQVARRHPFHRSVAEHMDVRDRELAQGIERSLAASALQNHQTDGEQGERGEEQAFAEVSDRKVQRRGDDEQRKHGFRRDRAHRAREPRALAVCNFVRAIACQAARGFGAAQAFVAGRVRAGAQRMIKIGVRQRASTCVVTEPSTTLASSPCPCEPIMTRS